MPTPTYLRGLSPNVRLSIQATRKKKLETVFYNRCPSVNINPKRAAETMIPILACNSDPATVNIPIQGKVIMTWGLVILWTGIMIMTCVVGGWTFASMKENPMYGPNSEVLVTAGAMSPDTIDSGEYWRLLWATQMHAGWIHLGLNVINFVPLGYILEPDWGTIKICIIFLCSIVSGSLASINGTDAIAVGASGGIFGLMAGLLVYIAEYWQTIPHVKSVFVLVSVVVVLSIALSFVPFVDKWAHIGGALGGLLGGLTLLRDLPVLNSTQKLGEDGVAEVAVDRSQSLPDKIRVYRITDDIYADVPSLANPALVKNVNSRAKRWVNLRRARRTADATSWVDENNMQMKGVGIWITRITSGVVMLTAWTVLIHTRFDLSSVWAKIPTSPPASQAGFLSNA